MRRVLRATMGTAARRPRLVGGARGVLAVAGARPRAAPRADAATGTLVERGSPTWQATEDLHRRFGDDAIYVLVRERRLRPRPDRGPRAPAPARGLPVRQRPAGAKSRRRARAVRPAGRDRPVKVVFGPATFLNTAVGQIQDQFTRADAAARRAGQAGGGRGAGARAAPGALARRRPSGSRARRASSSTRRRCRRSPGSPPSTGSAGSRASTTPASSRTSSSPRAGPRARPRRASPTCSPTATARSCRSACGPGCRGRPRPGARRRARGRRDAAVAAGQGRATRSPARPSSCRTSRPRSPARS